ncbi:transposase [Variovorax paradoxus]|uniref:transposase n=1 Tax=Variovorax paradoxus TaxID=34073 RepID=UPI0019342D7C|nr:transposase [Variovorax paradoxus]
MARDLSDWLGLTPGQYSTAGKTKLTGISTRGNTYVRTLFIHGALSTLHVSRSIEESFAHISRSCTSLT